MEWIRFGSLPQSSCIGESSGITEETFHPCHPAQFHEGPCTPPLRKIQAAMVWLVTLTMIGVLSTYHRCTDGSFAAVGRAWTRRMRLEGPIPRPQTVQQQKRWKRKLTQEEDLHPSSTRVLYTITTLTEFDSGTRSTTKGDDRMQKVLIPVMKEVVESLLQKGFQVDVFIVAHFHMTREHLIRDALPANVGLRIWDEASPITYDPGKRDNPNGKLSENTLGLARQHRFVVKDNLFHYDFFMCFEDDMIVKASQVENHLEMTKQLFQLRETAPDHVDDNALRKASGPLTKSQLQRIIPGIFRVEVLLDEAKYGTQKKLDPVPVHPHEPLDVKDCCHLSNFTTSPNRPAAPTSDQVFLWETGIQALGVRYIPSIGHVAFQRGPKPRQGQQNLTTTDYWSGEGKEKYFGKERRPPPGSFSFINNQGGWMGTRQQIWEWHTEVCLGGFLPPYESPHYNFDGLDPRNVEWWSGAMQLFSERHACNMHRILSLNATRFAHHIAYHSANNKQRQLAGQKRRFVKIDDLYGQLLTVQQNYEIQHGDEHKKAMDNPDW